MVFSGDNFEGCTPAVAARILRHLAAHGDEIKVDGKRLAIVGNSVGGNMTAAVALMALHKGGPEFKCQVMLWPVTDANFETESYREYADGYFLSRAMMMLMNPK